MDNIVLSMTRTFVPIIAGGVISWFASKGLTLDEEFRVQLITALTVAIQVLYYTVVRLLELKCPKAGLLLGSKTQPNYEK